MEGKERYEWNSRFDEAIKDNQTGDIVNAVEVLNQQDKEIKKLEEYNNKYPYHYSEEYMKNNRKLEEQNQQLKQQIVDSESKRKILEEKVKWLSEENEECFVDGQKYNELREQKDKEIQQLKQQLAEKENTITTLIEDSKTSKELLKKQLEEKDKEIKKLTEELDDKNFCKNFVDLYTENKLKTQMLHENWKDKISFTIQQLEKVKNKIESKVESIYKILDDLNIKIVGESTSRELNAYEEIAKDIDNQIKQLKEGK